MKFAQDLSLVLGTAVLTALLAGPLLGPGTADAVDEAAAPTEPAPVPVLGADVFQLSLTLDQESYEPGQTPVLLFKAVHTGEEAAELKAEVRMKSLRREMFRSRMPPLPAETFSTPVSLKLEPGETKILKLATEVKLVAGSENTFEIQVGDQEIVATTVSLPAPLVNLEEIEQEIFLEVEEDVELVEEPIIEDVEVAPDK